ncbi:phosphohistidine phosphatase [Faunimonas pinastri]|uniref:Phosphohistidine phosphatase n=2 Tax=Faunimonas pinastri TaxID=1855383 RepID=A0A1H9FAN5_9HYPH|nr:phosphohistidine phosphatase [Faunimonas pinastri]
MGRLVAARDWRPDLILCSPSRRTRETLVEVQKSLDGGTAVHFLPELYNGAENEYRAAIRRSGAEAACLLLIGHNPTIHQTALHLSASGSPGLIEQLRQSFPPAAFATIEVDGAWDAINSDAGRLVDLVTPEEAFRQLAL